MRSARRWGGRSVSPGARPLMGRAEAHVAVASVGPLLEEGAVLLREAGLPRARRDAEWLLAGLLGPPRWRLSLEPDRPVAKEVAARFLELIHRRRGSEPLQYLLGWEEFCGLRLRVTPAAMIPRPETELLVKWASELLSPGQAASGAADETERSPLRRAQREPGRPPLIVDLGTGSGAIALALAAACPALMIYAVELAPRAMVLARENVAASGAADRVVLLQGDLFDPMGPLAGAVDLVISNPPYIPSGTVPVLPREVREYEPREALDGGPDGMSVHRKIIAGAPRFLRPGGWLLLELGEGHSDRLSRLLEATGFVDVQVRKDLSGVERMIGARWVGRGAEGGVGDQRRGAEGGVGG